MHTVRLSELELAEAGYENDPTMRARENFPFSAATGTKNTAVVYFEVEPGHRLGTHTDSAEEILLLLVRNSPSTPPRRSLPMCPRLRHSRTS
jgi:quercetin dioxygenase-like cupin family protein